MKTMDISQLLTEKAAKLLVVDDSRAIRAGLCVMLEQAGYQVDTAEDGKQALEKVYQQDFDLLLMDVVMPKMDGLQALSILRHSYSKLDLPIIMATSRNSAEEVAKGLELGANDYVSKPLDEVVLKARVENQLLQKQAAFYLRSASSHLEREVKRRTSQLQVANQQLDYQANYDLLTGLPNRALAYDRLQQMIYKAQRNNEKLGLMFVDLDDFKTVNDTLGHAAGDLLLQQTAKRLLACARESDTVARLGGDEFMLILAQGSNGKLDVTPVAQRILQSFSDPFNLDGQQASVGTSLGAAIYPSDADDIETLIANADVAMYKSKSEGRHKLNFFSSDMAKVAERRLQLENELRHALQHDEFELVYQPIIDAQNAGLAKFEVLLRWQNETLGTVPPDEFIALAESSGAIVPIGEWVLNKAAENLSKWRCLEKQNLRAALNISPVQFHDGERLIASLSTALERYDLPADSLEFEVTEGIYIRESEEILKTLNNISQMGVSLSLDDFGTGYSSLSYLRRFDFDILKIDRSFVNNILNNDKDALLVKSIITLANSMGMDVVAEGVEELAQSRFLQQANCDYVQGYFFSRPLKEHEFLAFYQQSKVSKTTGMKLSIESESYPLSIEG